MGNHAHVLKTPTRVDLPDRFIIVQATAKREYSGEADEFGNYTLGAWRSMVFDRHGKSSDLSRTEEGTYCDGWRKELLYCAKVFKSVVIVSSGARDIMALLGLWDMAEDRTIEFCELPTACCGSYTDKDERRRNQCIVLESPPTIVCFRHIAGPCKFCWIDPANFGAGDMGQLLRTSHPAATDDIDGLECWQSPPEALELQIDSVRLWLASYIKMISDLNLGAFKHTAASQAAYGWRRSYMPCEVHIHGNADATALERAALFGGRCEAAALMHAIPAGTLYNTEDVDQETLSVLRHVGGIYHLDVNSLYPSVAAANRLPVRLGEYLDSNAATELVQQMRAFYVIADVHITIDMPVAPWRFEGNENVDGSYTFCRQQRAGQTDVWGTMFPIGSFRTTLCGPELELVRQCGRIDSVYAAAWYDTANLYGEWVNALYMYRLTSKRMKHNGQAAAAKAILNSSFGKWGQQRRAWVACPDRRIMEPYYQWYEPDFPEHGLACYRSIGWQVQKQVTDGEHPDSFPAITAWINSLGRVRLWQLIQTAGPENVLYYDTDSLLCTYDGAERLDNAGEINETELGKLSKRGHYQDVQIWGLKAYQCDGKVTLSGADSDCVKAGDAFALSYRHASTGYFLTRHQAPGIARHLARVRLQRPYAHGKVGPDGRVTPHVIQ